MVVDQLALGVADRAFDSMQLLSEFEATPFGLNHGNDRA
jgi:hypothetical protein